MGKREKATQILKTLRESGFEAYFAGGCVRDRLRGEEPKDFDIATSARPDQVQGLFEKTVPVGAQFGVVLVVRDGDSFELATFRTEDGYRDGRHPGRVAFTGVKEDARRRDFTVNGMYWDPVSDEILDFVGGREDLKARRIRCIGEPETRFLEDHLRMLRAVRFAVQLGFEIAPDTWQAVRKHAGKIGTVSRERIREEWSKILTSENPARGLRLLDESGMLIHILPEMERMKGVEQPAQYHPEGDVYTHTLLLMEGLRNAPIELAMGCLLHDVAKPDTFERAPDRIRFNGHDKLGAEKAEEICRRMAFSNQQTKLIRELVAQHLRFKDALNMKVSTLKRFLSLERFDLHLELHRLDCLASHGDLTAYEFCKARYEELLKEPPPPARLVTGQDLIGLGLKPGPEFKAILRDVEDQILEGRLRDREAALAYVRRTHGKKGDRNA